MKSALYWIIGIIVTLWLFSGNKNHSTLENTTYETSDELNNQLQETYEQSTIQDYSPTTFKGYLCTFDCSGHEAGYEWAEEKGIDDPEACGGKSDSFIEGCQAYAKEQQDAMMEEIDNES